MYYIDINCVEINDIYQTTIQTLKCYYTVLQLHTNIKVDYMSHMYYIVDIERKLCIEKTYMKQRAPIAQT